MATITDTLLTLAQDFRDAIATVRGIEGRVKVAADTNAGRVTTIINQFNARPLYETIYIDPVNGDDTKDGTTIATAKRDIDTALASLGSQGTSFLLLGDVTIRRRHTVGTNIQFQGIQPANTAIGYTSIVRQLSFLGTAINSPNPFIGSYSSGLIFNAGSLASNYIDILLPDVPAGLDTRAHIVTSAFLNVLMLSPTIRVASQNAAALFGSFNNGRITSTINPVLGAGAAGHIFQGIAAGADPNASWLYPSNLKAA